MLYYTTHFKNASYDFNPIMKGNKDPFPQRIFLKILCICLGRLLGIWSKLGYKLKCASFLETDGDFHRSPVPCVLGDWATFFPTHHPSVHCWVQLWDSDGNNRKDHHPVLNTTGSLPLWFQTNLSGIRKAFHYYCCFTCLKSMSTWKYKLGQSGRRKMTKLHYLDHRH